ncbi:MAG: CAP domain-containing protein, partial [Rubrivivax sp.]
ADAMPVDEPAAAPAPPSPSAAATRATCALPDFEVDAMASLNAHRAAGAQCGDRGAFAAAPPLAWEATLSLASLAHSDDMVSHNFFSHTGSDGSSAGQRASDAGYLWSTWGENIADGQNSVDSVVTAWMGSPGHCANIMNAGFRDIGLACVNGGAGNATRSYWTMTLGRSR